MKIGTKAGIVCLEWGPANILTEIYSKTIYRNKTRSFCTLSLSGHGFQEIPTGISGRKTLYFTLMIAAKSGHCA